MSLCGKWEAYNRRLLLTAALPGTGAHTTVEVKLQTTRDKDANSTATSCSVKPLGDRRNTVRQMAADVFEGAVLSCGV